MIIETKRLSLRPFTMDDLSSLHSIFSDPETMAYYPAPFSEEQTKSWIKRNLERYQVDGFGLWGVLLKENNQLIGDCGLVKQTITGKTYVEIGYHINKIEWSKDYATEAAMSCMDYGFNTLGLNKLISIIDPKNHPSIRVAEKIGFTKEQDLFVFNKIHSIYSDDRSSINGHQNKKIMDTNL